VEQSAVNSHCCVNTAFIQTSTDQLVRLETFIREGFIQKQHVTALFFDLEKAYNTTWKYGIMKDLHDAGLRGRLPLFIVGYLSDRKFQVRVCGTYSKLCEQEMCVPQGSTKVRHPFLP